MKIGLDRLGSGFDAVTYYGDAPWDRECAGALGWNFVAVGARVNGCQGYDDLTL